MVIHNSPTHFIKSVHLNGRKIVTCDLQMERETLQDFFHIHHKCCMILPFVKQQTSS
jgi:hypothetical protein